MDVLIAVDMFPVLNGGAGNYAQAFPRGSGLFQSHVTSPLAGIKQKYMFEVCCKEVQPKTS